MRHVVKGRLAIRMILEPEFIRFLRYWLKVYYVLDDGIQRWRKSGLGPERAHSLPSWTDMGHRKTVPLSLHSLKWRLTEVTIYSLSWSFWKPESMVLIFEVSFTHCLFVEHLLCAGACSRPWGYNLRTRQRRVPALRVLTGWGWLEPPLYFARAFCDAYLSVFFPFDSYPPSPAPPQGCSQELRVGLYSPRGPHTVFGAIP